MTGSDGPTDNSFPKSARLRNSAEFSVVFKSGVVCSDHLLVLHATNNTAGSARLGLAIGKRVGNAVVRNKWKRAIREAFRTRKSSIPSDLDLVIRPRKGATYDAVAIRKSIVRLSKLAKKRLAKQTEHPRKS